ncbi:hypothetical protein Dsin_006538 [Dipteronia sinensis]|uniref:Protein pelota homolog n=1 Tax=Dipteronia sinensis TaxID=43782 RepID=A0AAE0AYL2_9ROSI|nr:hypothetical protein Dsin_006538 [Dipteronia sinensis]
MKLFAKKIGINQPGTVKITPEEPDDLWVVYNLISPGDVVVTDTTRKVSHPTASGKGKGSTRVTIKLEIRITNVDYEKDSSILRVKGRNVSQNEHVVVGAFHTLELEQNKQFDLTKKVWDSNSIDALREGRDKSSVADLAVILMHQNLARLYLVGGKTTKLCENVEDFSTSNKKDSNKFFENLFRAFVKHVDFDAVKCVVIGSPGSVKDEFRSYLLTEAQELKIKRIEENKSRILVMGTAKNVSLEGFLKDNAVMNLIKGTKAALEIRVYNEFSDMLSSNPDRACYGPKNVETAHDLKAIDTLLITDDLVRSAEIKTRQKYVELVKSVKDVGGKAFVYSSKHVSGEQLATLTGIAAILRFPLPHLDDMVV